MILLELSSSRSTYDKIELFFVRSRGQRSLFGAHDDVRSFMYRSYDDKLLLVKESSRKLVLFWGRCYESLCSEFLVFFQKQLLINKVRREASGDFHQRRKRVE